MTRLERFSEYLRESAPPPIVAPLERESHQRIMYNVARALGITSDGDRVTQQPIRRAPRRDGAR